MVKKKAVKGSRKGSKSVSLRLKTNPVVKINSKRLGFALGKVTALCVFVVTLLGLLGIWKNPGQLAGVGGLIDMMYGSIGYNPLTWVGLVWGSILGFIDGYIGGVLIGYFYNNGPCFMKK